MGDYSNYYASATSSAIGSYLKGQSDRRNIEEAGKKARENISNAKDDYIIRSQRAFDQEEAINEQLAQVMSSNGLEALKAESRLRTKSASVGASGNSIDELVNQSAYDEIFDNQVEIAKARRAKLDTETTRLNDYMNFKSNAHSFAQANSSNMSDSDNWLSALTSMTNTYVEANKK